VTTGGPDPTDDWLLVTRGGQPVTAAEFPELQPSTCDTAQTAKGSVARVLAWISLLVEKGHSPKACSQVFAGADRQLREAT